MKSSRSNNPRLVVIEGKDKGKIISLKHGTVVLGRSKGDVIIHDPRISRSHLALHYDEKTEKLTCTDMKSLNGTIINGDTTEAGELQDGDKIQIGDTILDCQIGVAEETLASYRVAPNKMKEGAKAEEKKPEPAQQATARKSSSTTKPKKATPQEEPDLIPLGAERAEAFQSKSLFARIPTPVRVTALVLVLSFLYVMGTDSSGPVLDTLEREITSVRNLESEGKHEEAVERAEKIARKYSENSKSHVLLGDLYAQRNKREQALMAYRRAHALKPVEPLVHIRLIRLYLKTGLLKEGLEELKHVEQIIREGQENAETKEMFIETAKLLLEFKDELKQPPEKMLIIAKALQNSVAPDSSIGYKLEAEIFFQQNRFTEAIDVLEKARSVEPKDEGTLNALVKAKIFSKDMEGAQKVVETWMQVAPNATRPLIVAAFLKFNEKNYIAALPFLQKVIQILAKTPQEPDYGQALHNMGVIYYEQNQMTDAENAFRQACDLGVNDSCAHPLLKGGDKPPASIPN